MAQPLIELTAARKAYKLGGVKVDALIDVDLRIGRGEFTALAGPSGSGKTTLLNIIGLIDKADSGSVVIDAIDTTSRRLHSLASLRRETIGFVFQTFNLVPVLTAYENVEYPLLLRSLTRRERHACVTQWLDNVGLAAHAGKRPDQLSGGERQRVAIARAMAGNPKIVLADEPTANLDSETATRILDLLADINRKTGVTFIFATHDPALMARAERCLYLRDGRIASERAALVA